MMIEKNDQLIDIYDIWYQSFFQHVPLKKISIIFIIISTIGLLFFFYKKYQDKKKVVDCADKAFQELYALRKMHIVTKVDSKNCYFRLSLILKQYLVARYDSSFAHLTDKEIITHAQLYLDQTMVEQLKKILTIMMLIKFEHEVAWNEKLHEDIELIENFIQQTTAYSLNQGT